MGRRLHSSLMPLIEHKAIEETSGEGGTIYMLMPLFQGGSLWDHVHKRLELKKPLSGAEMLAILDQVSNTYLRRLFSTQGGSEQGTYPFRAPLWQLPCLVSLFLCAPDNSHAPYTQPRAPLSAGRNFCAGALQRRPAGDEGVL